MKNSIHDGNVVNLIAPSGGVTSGVPVKIGNMIVVPITTAAQGETFAADRAGAFEVTKLNTATFAQGAPVYWDSTNNRATGVTTGNTFMGHALDAAANGDLTARVVLVPHLGAVSA